MAPPIHTISSSEPLFLSTRARMARTKSTCKIQTGSPIAQREKQRTLYLDAPKANDRWTLPTWRVKVKNPILKRAFCLLHAVARYKRDHLVFNRLAFLELVNEITQDIWPGAQVTALAIEALQEEAEVFVAVLMEGKKDHWPELLKLNVLIIVNGLDAGLCARVAHRATIQPRDIKLALRFHHG